MKNYKNKVVILIGPVQIIIHVYTSTQSLIIKEMNMNFKRHCFQVINQTSNFFKHK
jgi:hypothetical protein